MDKRINTMGKVGRIISTIIAVFMILAAILTAVGVGVFAVMPKDSLEIVVSGNADVTAKGEFLESIANAVLDSSEGGKGEVFIGGSDSVAIGNIENDIPEDVNVQKKENGIILSVNNAKLNTGVGRVLYVLCVILVDLICGIIVMFMIRTLMKSIELCETPFCDNVIKNMKNFGFSLIPFAFLRLFSENLPSALYSDKIDFSLGVDLTVVIGILVVFMLVMIFTYGAKLQKESNETL